MCPWCSMLIAAEESTCPNCGLDLPPGHGQPPLVRVDRLGIAVATLLSLSSACAVIPWVYDAGNSELLGPVSFAVFIALVPTFITWLFLVGRNARQWGPQRRNLDWAIIGWSCRWSCCGSRTRSRTTPGRPRGRPMLAECCGPGPSSSDGGCAGWWPGPTPFIGSRSGSIGLARRRHFSPSPWGPLWSVVSCPRRPRCSVRPWS
jgi:hypothetical protein